MKFYALLALSALFAAAGCENVDMQMHDQVTYKVQEYPKRTNPRGSVPTRGSRDKYEDVEGRALEPMIPMDEATARRGKKLYDIYCAVCHGITGRAESQVAQKMDLQPFDLTDEDILALTDGEIFIKIVASDTVMPNYRNQLSDVEAWEIVAYVRQLQKGIPQ